MVQFTHLRIAHTKISFYFGNPKSRGKICLAARCGKDAAACGGRRETAGIRRVAAVYGGKRHSGPGTKKRGKPRLSSLLVNPLGSQLLAIISFVTVFYRFGIMDQS